MEVFDYEKLCKEYKESPLYKQRIEKTKESLGIEFDAEDSEKIDALISATIDYFLENEDTKTYVYGYMSNEKHDDIDLICTIDVFIGKILYLVVEGAEEFVKLRSE